MILYSIHMQLIELAHNVPHTPEEPNEVNEMF